MAHRILIAEDSRTQAEELRSLLEDVGFEVEVGTNGREALEMLERSRPDMILSDLFMPEMDGFAFCQAVKSRDETRRIPFILLTQLNTPGGIAIGLQHGADDFVPKPYDEDLLLERVRALLAANDGSETRADPGLGQLPLERASLLLDQREQALRTSHAFLEQLVAGSPGIILRAETRLRRISYISPNIEALLGFAPEEVLRSSDFLADRIHPDEKVQVLTSLHGAYLTSEDGWRTECRLQHQDGSYHWFYISARFDESATGGSSPPLVAHLLNIDVRKEAEARIQSLNKTLELRVQERTADAEARARELAASEEALRQSNAALRTLIAGAPLAIVGFDPEGRVTQWNPAAEQMLGWNEAEVLGRKPPFIPAYAGEEFQELLRVSAEGGRLRNVERRRERKDGTPIDLSLWTAPLWADGRILGVISMMEDVTQRKQLEEQLRQTQKMEAFGQLAGGIAHDFNNMLAVISGYSEVLAMLPGIEGNAREFVDEIHAAAERAAALTRQLLAFSRKQVLEPKTVDLSALVEGTVRMLRRLIGEDIAVRTRSEPELGKVRADPGQIEQVLMNLVVNARDAMPRGGSLLITASNAEISEESRPPGSPVPPGAYVQLSVTDSGCGMSKEVLAQLFEPFFTTKEPGKGTGLGLATVYGIVTQSEGYITVESEPGQGTTFRIYLPRVDAADGGEETGRRTAAAGGVETILLVEDEPSVRQLVNTLLQSQGYTVLEATNPGDALRICERYTGTIHLLLTDVVMPGMSGRELHEHLRQAYPPLRVLFMSGYMDDAVLRHGVLTDDADFIQKPFAAASLAGKLREVLDRPDAPGNEAG
ncbi:MAG: response regulator [Armatimonadota bacterium]